MAYERLNMLVDAVGAKDEPIGTIHRAELFRSATAFRVVHVIVRNSRGEVLLQHIAPKHPRSAGLWGSSAAGYLQVGESYEHAARRKLLEELHLRLRIVAAGKTSMLDDGCKKFIGVFTAVTDRPVRANPHDADEIVWQPWATVMRGIRATPDRYTATFAKVMHYLRTRGE